jgi:hypothetical protein
MREKVERFPSSLLVFAFRACRACLALRAVSQSGDRILDGFRYLGQDTSLVGQIDDVVF